MSLDFLPLAAAFFDALALPFAIPLRQFQDCSAGITCCHMVPSDLMAARSCNTNVIAPDVVNEVSGSGQVAATCRRKALLP